MKTEEKQRAQKTERVCEKFTFSCRGKNLLHAYTFMCLNITNLRHNNSKPLKKTTNPKTRGTKNPNNNPNHKTKQSISKLRKCL